MENLPLPLLHHILEFALPGYAGYLPPERRNGVTFVLKDLKLLARAWVAPMRELVRQYRDSTLVLRIKTASAHELEQICQTLRIAGGQITEFVVTTGSINRWSYNFTMPFELWNVVQNVEIDWRRIFAQLPELKSLNLEENYINSPHIIQAIEAAATHCPNLETLVLPADRCGGDDENIQAVLEKLYDAMKRWRVHRNGGGLRHLKVPTRNILPYVPMSLTNQRFKANQQFFGNVMENSPDVEYLDGYKASLSRMDKLTCKDFWLLTLEDWERFNMTCTKLREFDWVVAPFGDPFFRVFGQHVKPQMKKLTFGVNMHWKWSEYFREACGVSGEESGGDSRPGYGFLATDPATALNGCPLLDQLLVKLYHAVDRNMFIPRGMGHVFDFPEEEMVDQNIFNDLFCETLASKCPFLTHFEIKEVGEYFNRKDLKPIETFTDRALMALTRLKFLRTLKLRSVNCTGHGILEFLNAQSSEFTGNRAFEITVGGCPEDSRLAFYEVIKALLTQVANMKNLLCSSQKFALRIENWSFNSRYNVESAWSEVYFSDLEKLMNRVKDAHPSFRQHLVTMDHVGKRFSRIAEFGLFTEHTDPSIYSAWDDWEQEEQNVGITVVNREDLLPDDRSAGESDYSGYAGSDFSGHVYGDFYDGESDIDSEYFEDDSDFEM